MKDDIWIERASKLEPFDGKGFSVAYVARQTGFTAQTVKRYGEKFGFTFGVPYCGDKRQISRPALRKGAVAELAAQGLTRQEVAERLGVSHFTVGHIARKLGIKFRHASEGVGVDKSRAEAMAAMFKSGKTLHEIGELYCVTRERVRQIIKKYQGLVGSDGGRTAAAAVARQKAKMRKDAYSLAKHGCRYEQYRDLVRFGRDLRGQGVPFARTPTGAFQSQRQNAISRGLEWNLKLWDWWQVWEQSGKWDQRGRAKDRYVMCRFRDDGPYEVGNVYIATLAHNSSFQPNNPYRKDHPDHEKVMVEKRKKQVFSRPSRSMKRKNPDLPIGVTRSNGRFQAQIGIGGKNQYLGCFATVKEAHSAYLAALATIEERTAA